jgi:hypothetical protein
MPMRNGDHGQGGGVFVGGGALPMPGHAAALPVISWPSFREGLQLGQQPVHRVSFPVYRSMSLPCQASVMPSREGRP